MITAGWYQRLVDRNIAAHDAKVRARFRARFMEVFDEAQAAGRDEVLALLDEETRKEAERKLRSNTKIPADARTEGINQVLGMLDKDTQKEVERRLLRNDESGI